MKTTCIKLSTFSFVIMLLFSISVKSQNTTNTGAKFRIQIASAGGSKYDEALKETEQAKNELKMSTYLIKSDNKYKILAGDFQTKKAAQTALVTIKKQYKDAWITPSFSNLVVKKFDYAQKVTGTSATHTKVKEPVDNKKTENKPVKAKKETKTVTPIENKKTENNPVKAKKETKKVTPKKTIKEENQLDEEETLNSKTPPNDWKNTYYTTANSAINENYLSKAEKEVFYYLNLVRMNPAFFAKTKLVEHIGKLNSSNEKSLYDELNKLKPLEILKPSKSLWESANCHATESGKRGVTGHQRQGACKALYMGECCSYGVSDALGVVIQLLVDEGVTTLGHRHICLGKYKILGVAMKPHKSYGTNAVLDFDN